MEANVNFWIYKFPEKYHLISIKIDGVFKTEKVNIPDNFLKSILLLADKSELFFIIDIKDADLFNVKHENLDQYYMFFNLLSNRFEKIRVVILSNDVKQDFLKASHFSKYENRKVLSKVFFDEERARNWLFN